MHLHHAIATLCITCPMRSGVLICVCATCFAGVRSTRSSRSLNPSLSRSLKPLAQATHSSRVKLPFAQADVPLSRPLRPPFTQAAYSSRRALKPPARSSCSLKSLKPPLAHDSRRSCKSCRRSLKPPLAEAVRSNVSCDERPTHGDACEPSQRTAAGHKMGL